jgi:hypothetical protein
MSESEAVANTGEESAVTTEVAKPSMTGEDGGWNKEYLDSLPDDMGSHSSFEKYKNPEEYFKGGVNAHKLAVSKAEDFWSSEDADHIAKRMEIMGVPNDTSGYEFEPVAWSEGMPAEVINAHYEEAKGKFKDLGISKEQAVGLIEWDSQNAIAQFAKQNEEVAQQQKEAEGDLRKEWPGDKFEYNLEKTKNAIEHLNGSDIVSNENWGNDPAFIKWAFDNVVPLIANDTIIEARATQNTATLKDSLDAIDDKIWDTPKENLHTEAYNKLLNKRTEIIKQMS